MRSEGGIKQTGFGRGPARLGLQVLEADISNELAAIFQCIAEATACDGSLRYPRRVSIALARKIVCRSYGLDVHLLCHLVRAAAACGVRSEHYEWLFFTSDRVTPNAFRGSIESAVAQRGWQRPGFEATHSGVSVRYSDGAVTISFARMPLLTQLLELLIETVSYTEIDRVFRRLLVQPPSQENTKRAANVIRGLLYDYLSRHLPSARRQEKFDRILKFVRTRGDGAAIDDNAVLDFWRRQSVLPNGRNTGFRLFRTVVQDFVRFIRALQVVNDQRDIEKAVPFDEDRGSHVIDPVQFEELFDASNCWRSPLDSLVDGPAGEIKFLTKRERENLSLLLDCGPLASQLPLSVIRSDVFGRCQARIVEALRTKRAGDGMTVLLACASAQTYGQRLKEYAKHREHIRRVLMAAAHATVFQEGVGETGLWSERSLGQPLNDAPTPNLAIEAKRAFDNIRRKGFERTGLDDPEVVEGFRTAAEALCAIADRIDAYLTCLNVANRHGDGLTGWFEADRTAFRDQFSQIYGEHADERAVCNSHRETIGSGEATV